MSSSVTGGTTAAYYISPGSNTASGQLTIGGTLNLTSYAILDFSNITGTTAGTNMDQIKVTGALNFSGGGQAQLILPGGLAYNTYKLIDAGAAGTANASSFTVSGGLPPGYTLAWDATNYDLNLTVAAHELVGGVHQRQLERDGQLERGQRSERPRGNGYLQRRRRQRQPRHRLPRRRHRHADVCFLGRVQHPGPGHPGLQRL